MSARSRLGMRSRTPGSDVRPMASRTARRAALVASSPTRSTPSPISRKTGKAPPPAATAATLVGRLLGADAAAALLHEGEDRRRDASHDQHRRHHPPEEALLLAWAPAMTPVTALCSSAAEISTFRWSLLVARDALGASSSAACPGPRSVTSRPVSKACAGRREARGRSSRAARSGAPPSTSRVGAGRGLGRGLGLGSACVASLVLGPRSGLVVFLAARRASRVATSTVTAPTSCDAGFDLEAI